MKAPIISINRKFDREKFERISKRDFEEKKKKNCNHDETTFDGEIDEVLCDHCTQKWNSFEYLWFMIERASPVKNRMFQIENSIHFLTEEKKKLEDDIFYLKKTRRSIKTEITKSKNHALSKM